jgi:hypothetical protein
MKRLICAVLVTVFFISSVPAFTHAAASEAQAVQFRTVWENPYTLTTYHPDDEVNSTFYTFPQVIWNGSQYVDYVLNSSDMSAGTGSVYIKVCPDHTVFYDPYQEEESIGSECWNVECYNASSLEWETDYPACNSVCYLVNSSGIYFERTTTLSSGATLDEWYWLRAGSELKISVTLHPVQATEYRLIWLLSGVSGTEATWLTTTENITTQVIDDPSCSSVRFASDNESKSLVDWSDALILNETTGKYETCFQQLELQKDASDGQCQARISFGDFALAPGEPLTLDPYVDTFSSTAASSGFIEQYGLCYPPSGGTFVDTTDPLIVGQAYAQGNGGYMIDRSYLSFNTSSIPAMAYNMSATLQLETSFFSSPVNFTVQVWGGNQPVCNGNLTIMDGTQPIYNDDLTTNSWGTGMVQVAAWNTANYQNDVYVNLTIPPNQVNKVDSTEFELKSSREGTPPQGNEFVQFYRDNSTGSGPELEVSYCLDTVTINGETWFYRNASTSKVAIVLFGGLCSSAFLYIRSIDLLTDSIYPPAGPEKYLDKIMFLDALVQNGFSVFTPSNSSGTDAYHSIYENDSTWVQDLAVWLVNSENYQYLYLFGFSGGGVVVGNEIQKDYASMFSAAAMNCAPVNWTGWSSDQLYNTAATASNVKVATFFPENVNDEWGQNPPFYLQMKGYYDNEIVDKKWLNWTGGHGDFFTPNCTSLDPSGDNDSVAVINWFNAAHPPSTPFTPSGPSAGYAQVSYGYTSGTIDPNGDNVSYEFNWGDGTDNVTGYVSSGTNVTVYHSWNSAGTYNITVRAQDAINWSTWSQPWTVTMVNPTLTISASAGGTTSPAPGQYSESYGSNVTVTADPYSDYVFVDWVLDGTAYFNNTVTVTMTANHTLAANFLPSGGGGCPYVYDWNGSAYVKDNNILPASEEGNGTVTQDYYLLQQSLVPVFANEQTSFYSLQIGEFESEIDYINQVKLIAVDHPRDTNVAVTPEGEILTYKNPSSPISAVDNNGVSELSEIATMNGNVNEPSTYFQGNAGDWLLLDFGNVKGPNANLILRDDMLCLKICLDVQVLNASGLWQTVETLHPRAYWSIEAVNMSAYLPKTGDFKVRLYFTTSHRLDYVGLDTSPPAPVRVYSAPPTLAIHSTMGDVTARLMYDDTQSVELVNGQYITIWFTLPSQPQDTTRSFILYTDGYYYTITP